MSADLFFREFNLNDIAGVVNDDFGAEAATYSMRIYTNGEWSISGSAVIQNEIAVEAIIFDLRNEVLLGPVETPFVWVRSAGAVDQEAAGNVHTAMTFHFDKQSNTVRNSQILEAAATVSFWISGRSAKPITWPINMTGGQDPMKR